MLPILVLMIDSDRFVTNFGPKNHATWPFLSMPWAVIRGWAIIQVWAINREFTVSIFSYTPVWRCKLKQKNVPG